ncbi:hypothetical protein V6N13_148294 [Hibiscus sabdariffa]
MFVSRWSMAVLVSGGVPDIGQRRHGSRLWKGLGLIWGDISENLVWNIGNGRQVDFWYANWIADLGPLFNHLVTERFIPDCVSVASMVTMEGEWNWNAFQRHLPTHVLLRIAIIKSPMPSFATDSIGWKLHDDQQFSVKSAYEFLCRTILSNDDPEEWGSVVSRSKWFAHMSAGVRNNPLVQIARSLASTATNTAVTGWQPPDEG